MCRGFIDHKGVMDEYTLTDGTKTRSVFREPHTWALIESFKVKDDRIVAVEATFVGAPYYIRSPWTKNRTRAPRSPSRAETVAAAAARPGMIRVFGREVRPGRSRSEYFSCSPSP